jgi:hypothetical protein
MAGILKAQAAYHSSLLLLLDTIVHPPCFERTCIRDNKRFASRKTHTVLSESDRSNELVSRCCIIDICCACGHGKTTAYRGLLATTPSLRPYHSPRCEDRRECNANPPMQRDCQVVLCIHDASLVLLREQCGRKGG